MARYVTPQPYHGPEMGDAIAKALESFKIGYSMARGIKLDNEDRARADSERQDARDRQDASDAARHHIYRGTRPVDHTSVVSGATLPSVGMPRESYDGDAFAATLEREFANHTRGALASPGRTPDAGSGAGSFGTDRPVAPSALSAAPSFSLGGGMGQGMGQGMGRDPATPTMETREAENTAVHVAVGLPGSFDPSTGTFRRATLPVAPIMQEPDYRQLAPGRFQDVGAMRDQQRQEFEAKLTEAMLLAEGRAGVQARHRVPSQHERISARVGELVSGGMSLAAASRQARLEHGLTDGDGNGGGRRADTPPEIARRNLPIYDRDLADATREAREARDLPLRSEYEVQGREDAFPGDSTAAANRLRSALGRQDEARLTRDSVRAEVLGLPWERPGGDEEDGFQLSPDDAREMDTEFREAAELYRALVAKGVPEARARRAYDARTRTIATRYGAPTVGARQ